MVYKRYIYRNGKRFGPYYYHTYRDKHGKTHSKYIDDPVKHGAVINPHPNQGIFKKHKTLFVLLAAILAIFLAIIVLSNEFSRQEGVDSNNEKGFSLGNIADNVKSFVTGFTADEPVEEEVVDESVSEPDEEPTAEQESPSEGAEVVEEEIEESIEVIEETEEQVNRTDEAEETNETEGINVDEEVNETSEEEVNITPESNESIVNETSIDESETGGSEAGAGGVSNEANGSVANNTESNITINESDVNITISNETNFSLNETNATNETLVNESNITIVNASVNITLQESTLQYGAVLGEPVRWEKRVKVNIEGGESASGLVIDLPEIAEGVSVKKIRDDIEEDVEASVGKPETEETSVEDSSGSFITTAFNFFLGFFNRGITGRVVEGQEANVEVQIDEEILESDEIVIGYETQAPYSVEEELSGGKRVKIIGPEEVHYENVLVFTALNETLNVVSPDRVKIYWEEENTYVVPGLVGDVDGNGVYDYIEWIVPHLSNQTFNIIVITDAEHLDENRTFISDIYDEVKEQDGVWSEEIPDQHFVRVTFERNLTSDRDITVLPRIVNGTPRIEIYEENGNDLIAEFTSLNDNKYNKIYLNNLQGEQDTFDLKVLDGSVEFDHIIDPTYYVNLTSGNISIDFDNSFSSRPIRRGFQIKWNITDVPTGNTIINATLCLMETSVDLIMPDADLNLSRIDNQTWSTGHWDEVNSQITNSTTAYNWFNVTGGSTLLESSWWCANVTDQLATDYNIGNPLTSFRLIDPDAIAWTEGTLTDGTTVRFGGTSMATFASSSYGTSSLRPYLTVYYDEAASDNPPVWASNSTNSTSKGAAIKHNVYWTDETALAGYVFSFDNGTGSYSNDSWISMTGTSNWSNVTKVVNSTNNTQIKWKVYANDSTNQWNVTSDFTYNTTNEVPTQGNPIFLVDPIKADENLVCLNQSTADNNSDPVYNIYNWLVNDIPLMVVNLPFDVNSSSIAKDYSGNGNNGTLINGTLWNASGKIGAAYTFDGVDDYILLDSQGVKDIFDPGKNFTISTWVYPIETSGNWHWIFSKAYTSHADPFYQIELRYNPGFDSIDTVVRRNDTYGSYLEVADIGNVPLNQWNHIVMTVDMSSGRLYAYVNGSLVGSDTTTAGTYGNWNTNSSIGINMNLVGTDYHFNGSLDDFRIYNRSLSALQVAQLFEESKNSYTNSSTIVGDELLFNENWTCQVTPSDLYLEGTMKFNSTIILDANPVVNLVSPPDTTAYSAITSVNLSCNVTDDIEIANVSFYTNTSGGTWASNKTVFPELPNNMLVDTYNGINMTGNFLLYHFNNDSDYNDNGTNVYDYSGNGYNGTTSGFDGDEYINAKYGKGIDLITDDYIDTNQAFTDTTTGTISAWINFSGFSGSTDYAITGNYNGGGFISTEYLVYLNNDQDLEVFLGSDGFVSTNYSDYVGAWHHIAVTWAPNDIDLYIDGINLSADSSFAQSVFGFTSEVMIGRDNDAAASPNPNRDFDGTIDEIAFFNRTLNSTEIAKLYNGTKNFYHANFTVKNVPEGTHKWNCFAYDNSSNTDWATSNWTFYTDVCGVTQLGTSTTLTSSQCEHYNMTADDIVFDCDGYTLTGNNSFTFWGIEAKNRDNITIRDCRFEEYAKTILLNNTPNSLIQNNTLYNISWKNTTTIDVYGVYLKDSDNITILQNNFTYVWGNSTSETCLEGVSSDVHSISVDNSDNVIVNLTTFNNLSGQFYADTSDIEIGCQGGYIDVGTGVYGASGTLGPNHLDIINSNITNVIRGVDIGNGSNVEINNSNFVTGDSLVMLQASYGPIIIYNNDINYSNNYAVDVDADAISVSALKDKVTLSNNILAHHGGQGIEIGGDVTNGVVVFQNTFTNITGTYLGTGGDNTNITLNNFSNSPSGMVSSAVFIETGASGSIFTNNTLSNISASGSTAVWSALASMNLNYTTINNCTTGIFISGDGTDVWYPQITNCGKDVHIYSSTEDVELFNPSFNKSRTSFRVNGSGNMEVYYNVRSNVSTQTGLAVESANVEIRNNTSSLLHNDTTDSNGFTVWNWILEYNQTGNASYVTGCTGSGTNISCATPHNFTAYKTGYETNSSNITVNESKTVDLTLNTPSILAYVPTTDNFSIAEPDNQTFSITFTNTTPVYIKWFVNSSQQSSFDNLTQFNWTGNYSQAGVYEIKVNISNIVGEDDQIWIMTVNDTNTAPTHNNPIFVPTSIDSDMNFSCLNQSTSDPEGDNVYNIYNWLVNGTSVMALNLPFNNNTNSTSSGAVKDYSSSGNNATLDGPLWKLGKVGGGYDFDGVDDSMSVPSSYSLNSTHDNMTFAFWINPKTPIVGGSNYIISKYAPQTNRREYRVSLSNSKISIILYNSTGSGVSLLSSTTIANNSFSFVAFSYNGTNLSLYINGTLSNSTLTDIDLNRYSNDIYFGYDSNLCASDCNTNMTLDGVQLYNRSLSAEQIYLLYLDGVNGWSNSSTMSGDETLPGDNWTCQVIPSDTVYDGTLKQNSTSISQAFSVAIDLSTKLAQQINWTLESLPAYNQSADGNNGTGITEYWVNVSVLGGTADLFMRANANLTTIGGDIILLANETYSYNSTNSSVPSDIKTPLTNNYSEHKIGDALTEGITVIYLKFFLNAPASQAAGIYNNTLEFKAVESGEVP